MSGSESSQGSGTGHSAEQALIDARRAKADRIRKRGENPFANDVVAREGGITLDIGALRERASGARSADGKYTEDKVKELTGADRFHVRGRVIAFRSAGGLSFLRLRDRTGEIQLLVSEAALGAGYAALEDIDLGDFVEAEGALTASKRGELSIEPTRIRMLTKALRPPPEKWHGLQDVETRYRQRYVDLFANPAVADVFRARSLIVRATRKLLDDTGFLEVETPTMHTLIGGAAAKPFTTHHNALDMKLFMRIAPELYLKRLLVGGLDRVYEIGRCYRNEGISTRHNPEFTMLEYYWAYATYDDLMAFTEKMLRGIDGELAKAMPEAHAKWKAERPFTIDEPFARIPMDTAVANAARSTKIPAWEAAVADKGGAGLVALLGQDFGEHIKEWAKSSPRAKSIDWGNFRKGWLKCENDGERLFAAYEYLGEPFLTEDYKAQDGKRSLPVFIMDYPFETSPLARRNDARPALVDRFELFIHGRELCNAFSELNDPDDQAERFREQVRKKAAGAEETMDYDEDYVRALEHGMPPAAGFGMGMDRLTMMLTNSPSIRDVVLFPLLRPEQ
ncbi:Lysyl-tRNA synthetase (class II) [Labilithrix luteola]|uniref:Lysine--tRNA ligase n=1 Tax=Labilithrix luteola TaxID=1391654 RepID=A0A0K1PX52_9BACT|nr:lysine--tRNA ligase [Labilithrix luteola]AKU98103.1 Lysyl-tRNA synthetase (class II) [Labilithrix luteola]